MSTPEQHGHAALELRDLNSWIEYQLGRWDIWAAERDADWLALPTNNPEFPTAGAMLMHAFTPMHRYADMALGAEPAMPPAPDGELTWTFIRDWAGACLARHRAALAVLDPADPARVVEIKTRSMGVVRIRATRCLTHALTHAAWHLGGIIHILRATGHEPPSRSDFLYWGVDQEVARHD